MICTPIGRPVFDRPAGITVAPRVRWIGRQFEDDENQLRLGETAYEICSCVLPNVTGQEIGYLRYDWNG